MPIPVEPTPSETAHHVLGIKTLASGCFAHFGSRALSVAMEQAGLCASGSASRASWTEIVDVLRGFRPEKYLAATD